MPAQRRRASDKPIPWWTDRHILGTIIQPLLAVAIVQAPDWLQVWIAALWSGLSTAGIITARQAQGRVGMGEPQSDG